MSELATISPLAAYLGSFMDSAPPAWALMLMAAIIHWFVFVVPPVAAMGFLDRKLGADIQMRIGPNRVSSYGVAQVFADTIKAFFKEDAGPRAQEPLFFRWGTIGAIVAIFGALGSVPMAENWALSNLDSGIFAALGALVVSNLFLFWAGYSSESEWAVLSSFRMLSTLTSCLVPAALSLVSPILIAGSCNFGEVVAAQGGMPWRWVMFHDPGAFISTLVLFLGLQLWLGRAPFDHASAGSEVAGGLKTEYSGVRRALMSFLEYASLFLSCALVVTTCLGGWQTPFNLESFGRAANVVQFLAFVAKTFVLVFVSSWIRWSLPRLRIDQIVALAWRVLVPMAITGSALTAAWMVVFRGKGFGDFL